MDFYIALLSFIVFLPALGAILLAFIPGQNKEAIRIITLVVLLLVLVPVSLLSFLLDPAHAPDPRRSDRHRSGQRTQQGCGDHLWPASADAFLIFLSTRQCDVGRLLSS